MKYKKKYKKKFKKLNNRMKILEGNSNEVTRNIPINTPRFDDEIENKLIDFIEVFIENGVSNNKDIEANIINRSNSWIDLNFNKILRDNNDVIIDEHYIRISIDLNEKTININGNIFKPNLSDFTIKYKKIDKYIDQLRDMKYESDKINFLENSLKLYNVSGLSREKSLRDLLIN